jgi:hypothetical protein
VKGNVANAGTLVGNAGTTLALTDNSSATLSAGTYNLANLTIDKPNGVSSAADLNVSGNFAISNGVLSMNGHTLALGATATATSGGIGAFVDGTMTKTGTTAVTFPVGNNGRRAMVGIEPVGATDASVYTVGYTLKDIENADHYDELQRVTGLVRVGGLEKWDIHGTAPSRIKLYWDDSEASGVTDLNTLVVVHYNSGTGKWEMMETNGSGFDENGGWIQTKPVSGYSPYGLGSKEIAENPLPVTFTGFAARQIGNTVELEWTTMSEKDNDYFEIERSVDGLNFVTIGLVHGAGDSAEKLTYSFTDNAPENGYAYYRLSQVDFDGTRSYAAKIVSVAYTSDGNISLSVVPNPTSGQFKVKITGAEAGKVMLMSQSGTLLRVVDIHGFMQTIDISDLPNGVYILKYQTDDKSRHERVVKL